MEHLSAGIMIGHLKEKEGLYFLKTCIAVVIDFLFFIYQKFSHQIEMKFGFIILSWASMYHFNKEHVSFAIRKGILIIDMVMFVSLQNIIWFHSL